MSHQRRESVLCALPRFDFNTMLSQLFGTFNLKFSLCDIQSVAQQLIRCSSQGQTWNVALKSTQGLLAHWWWRGRFEELLNRELYFSVVRSAAESKGACPALAGSPSPSAAPRERSVLGAGPCLAPTGAASAPPAAALSQSPSCVGCLRVVLCSSLLLPGSTALLPHRAAPNRTRLCISQIVGSCGRQACGHMAGPGWRTCMVPCLLWYQGDGLLGGWGWGHVTKKCLACLKHPSAYLKENIIRERRGVKTCT